MMDTQIEVKVFFSYNKAILIMQKEPLFGAFLCAKLRRFSFAQKMFIGFFFFETLPDACHSGMPESDCCF